MAAQQPAAPIEVEGYTQPGKIYCPEGHQMLILPDNPAAKSTKDCMRAVCCEKECEHHGIKYKILMPTVILQRVE